MEFWITVNTALARGKHLKALYNKNLFALAIVA